MISDVDLAWPDRGWSRKVWVTIQHPFNLGTEWRQLLVVDPKDRPLVLSYAHPFSVIQGVVLFAYLGNNAYMRCSTFADYIHFQSQARDHIGILWVAWNG